MNLHKSKRLDEVAFANHLNEFIRFYDRHKFLCDEMTGIKRRVIIRNKEPIDIEVNRHNFFYAIRRLNAFLIDNIHYISSSSLKKLLLNKMQNLENKYINDTEYKEFVNKGKLSLDDDIEFMKLYYNYLFYCLDLSYEIFMALQDSLMISTSNTTKAIKYYDFKKFFENLSMYRDELSNSLTDIKFAYAFDYYKKVLGYHYTYRFMVSKKDITLVDKIIKLTYLFLTNTSISTLIKESRGKILDDKTESKIYNKSVILKNMLSLIYVITNQSLSDRNILPKIDKKIIIDKTLI
jgi:hypothetical protein